MSNSSHFSKYWLSYTVALIAVVIATITVGPKIMANRAVPAATAELKAGHPGLAEELVEPVRHTLALNAAGCRLLLDVYSAAGDHPRELWANEACSHLDLTLSSAPPSTQDTPIGTPALGPRIAVSVPISPRVPIASPPSPLPDHEMDKLPPKSNTASNMHSPANTGRTGNTSFRSIKPQSAQALLKMARDSQGKDSLIVSSLYERALQSAPNDKGVVEEALNGLLKLGTPIPMAAPFLRSLLGPKIKNDPEILALFKKLDEKRKSTFGTH